MLELNRNTTAPGSPPAGPQQIADNVAQLLFDACNFTIIVSDPHFQQGGRGHYAVNRLVSILPSREFEFAMTLASRGRTLFAMKEELRNWIYPRENEIPARFLRHAAIDADLENLEIYKLQTSFYTLYTTSIGTGGYLMSEYSLFMHQRMLQITKLHSIVVSLLERTEIELRAASYATSESRNANIPQKATPRIPKEAHSLAAKPETRESSEKGLEKNKVGLVVKQIADLKIGDVRSDDARNSAILSGSAKGAEDSAFSSEATEGPDRPVIHVNSINDEPTTPTYDDRALGEVPFTDFITPISNTSTTANDLPSMTEAFTSPDLEVSTNDEFSVATSSRGLYPQGAPTTSVTKESDILEHEELETHDVGDPNEVLEQKINSIVNTSHRTLKKHGGSEIKVFNFSSPHHDEPVKLNIRLVGTSGRVMVRVGGGWSDLDEYLRNYANRHGSRQLSDARFNIQNLHTSIQEGLKSSPANNYTPPANGRVTPTSRPGSAMSRPVSSLRVQRKRQSSISSATGPTTSSSARGRHVSAPYNVTPTSTSNIIAGGSSDEDSVYTPVTTPLGLAGPKSRNVSLSADKQAWIEGMVGQARKAATKNDSKRPGSSGSEKSTRSAFDRPATATSSRKVASRAGNAQRPDSGESSSEGEKRPWNYGYRKVRKQHQVD